MKNLIKQETLQIKMFIKTIHELRLLYHELQQLALGLNPFHVTGVFLCMKWVI